MKTVTPAQLQSAWDELYPQRTTGSRSAGVQAAIEDALRSWLEGYQRNPERYISTSPKSRDGENTRALFKALGIKQPKRKTDMLAELK